MRRAALVVLLAAAAGCRCPSGGLGGGDAVDAAGHDAGDGATCVNLACFQVSCPGGGTSSLSGVVYAPNGTLPLFGVTVYVPNAPLAPFVEGATCDQCSTPLSGSPLVQTETDTEGRFTLTNVPVTSDVPLVITVGKWRREIVVPAVAMCADTPLPATDTRLPRNASEGDIPRTALATGGADALECLLRKIGIDDAEIGVMGGPERVHLYAGVDGTSAMASGTPLADAQLLWASVGSLSTYDVVLLSCEGGQNPGTKPPEALQAMFDYTSAGGRVFASHWHNYWLQAGPAPFPMVAAFNFQSDLNAIDATIDTSFQDGMDLASWLLYVGGSTTLGTIAITAAQHTVVGVDAALARRWIYLDTTANGTPSVQYLSFTTPLSLPEEMRCGRVVLSDIHVSSGDTPGPAFPGGCTTTDLSPQEKVLAFMLFDIASCVGIIE